MNISFENALGPHAAALQLRSERATLIANNLANADTPNFKARDIDFKAALSSMLDQSDSQFNARIRTTNKGHMSAHGGGPNSPGTEKQVLYRVPSMSSLDGNTVDGQRE
ncbi:MAG: flagellar basal body rod protein FlgB, partial [Pseudomonadales bacterium]|nr:flagellar basal body rod protein FlgB [Pseudomonadales bacterium]